MWKYMCVYKYIYNDEGLLLWVISVINGKYIFNVIVSFTIEDI